MPRWHRLLVIALAALGPAACGSTARWTYPPNLAPPYTAQRSDTARVAVLTGDDRRGSGNSDLRFLAFLPFVFKGPLHLERPEAAFRFLTVDRYGMDMSRDLALAVAEEFRRSRLFPAAFFSYGGDTDGAWTCEVSPGEFRFDGGMVTYGLSIFGTFLWILGFPNAEATTSLDVGIRLRDAEGREVWQGSVRGEETKWIGMYYGMGEDAAGFAVVFEREFRKLLPAIEAALAARGAP